MKTAFEYDNQGRKIAEHEYLYFSDDEPDPMSTSNTTSGGIW